MKKILVIIVVVIVLLVGALVLGRNVLARMAIIKGVKAVTGMTVDVGNINIGLIKPGISVAGLKVYNPESFTDRLLADVPEIYCNIDLPGLFQNRVHVGQLTIDISELDIILDKNGKLNVNSLALVSPKPKPSGETSAQTKPGAGNAAMPKVQLDDLWLKIGKVVYKGYLPAVGVKEGTFTIGIDEHFKNVTDPATVGKDILTRILNRIGIGNFANFDIKAQATQLKEQAQQAAQQASNEVMQKATEDLKGLFSK